MKKVVIIGAGVSGLSTGIFLQKNGYDCEIFEKNREAGGNLTGWNRNGYHIDNCIHWLTGTRKGNKLYSLWKEVGALDDNTDIYNAEFLFSSEKDGQSVFFYRDPEKARRKMLAVSYSDKDEINRFFDAVNVCVKTIEGSKNPINLAKEAAVILRYGKMSLNELARKFKSPLLSCAFTDFIGGEFSSMGLIFAYSAFVSGNGGIPKGGSSEMAKRILNKYLSLGGKIRTSAEVTDIITENDRAKGVILADKTHVEADFVVSSCDPAITFSKFLPKESMPKQLKYLYSKRVEFPIFSAFHVALSADTDTLPFKGTTAFDTDPINIDNKYISRITVREFSHEKKYAPAKKSIIQCLIFLHENSCNEWIELKKSSPEEYKRKKEKTASEIVASLEKHFPELKGKLQIIDTWTPATYKRYLNSLCGSFMSFAVTGKKMPIPSGIIPRGFSNIVLAGQWMRAPGGLPIALRSGVAAAKKVISLSQ